jgi:hypothetical protein
MSISLTNGRKLGVYITSTNCTCALLMVQVEASNFGAWFESLGGTEGGFPFGYRALSLMERK